MKSLKKNKHQIKTLCAIAGIAALIGQPLLVFAATPLTAANVVQTLSSSQNSAEGNAAKNKEKLPTLSVTFDKSSAKTGDTITATAAPVGFAYDDDSLYYTWFLKHKSQDQDDPKGPNQWKMEAAKIIARGNFDKTSANYGRQIFGNRDKGYLALPGWGLDKDDYSGADKTSVANADAQNCYLQDYDTGKIWELRTTESDFNCPSGSSAKCVNSQSFVMANSECAQDVGGGDPITKSACVKGEQEDPTCSIADAGNYASTITCGTGYSAMCVKNSGTVFPNNVTRSDICSAFNFTKGNATGLACDDASIYATPVGPDGVTPSAIPNPNDDGTFIDGPLECTRVSKDNSCKHLFPKIGVGKVGDGFYKIDEEQAWGTNPAVKSTAGNDNNDEMNLVGLNRTSFTWQYQEGDEVGVVVEGKAQQGTSHDDGTKMISWAFSKNTCPALSKEIKDHPGAGKYYLDKRGKLQAGILTLDSFDLNDCLKDNLIDPAIAGTGSLDVSLMYAPQNPANFAKDAKGASKGDTVTVTSNVNNVVDASDYYYKWIIEGRSNNAGMENIDDTGWRDITSHFDNHTPLEGIGKTEISFKMDLSDSDLLNNPDPNIRVRLTVQEAGDGSPRSGAANTVIKITNQKTGLIAYGVTIENGKPVLDKNLVVCSQNEEPCVVAKNEIVGVVLPNDPKGKPFTRFSWKRDNDELQCDSTVSSQCTGGNTVFFPATGEENDSIVISAKAKTSDADVSQEYTKTFNIAQPSAQITPADSSASFKTLGTLTDLDGNVTPQYSNKVIEAGANSDITLKAVFSPTFIEKNTTYAWTIDGQTVNSNANDTVTLHSGDQNTVNNIDLAGTYVQPAEVRKALKDIWGVDASDSQESDIQNSVQVETPDAAATDTGSDTPMGAMGSPGRFFASLITDMPSQLMFFVRIILTMALLLLATGVLFSVIPGAAETERRRI